jgi:hypothetical protein
VKLQELRSEVAFLVNFTESIADQDFVTTRLNKAIAQIYSREVELGKVNGSRKYFQMRNDSYTWLADQQTFTIPESLQGKTFIDINDITSGEPGSSLNGSYFWADRKTLQWSTVGGPGSDVSLRFVYEATAEVLLGDDAEPQLIPPQFHWLLVWGAAILLRKAADEAAPKDWKDELEALQVNYYKHVSRGRPTSVPNSIRSVSESGGTSSFEPTLDDSYTGGLNPP